MTIPELYHRLQNLSHYPHALPLARRFLLTMLSDNLASASSSDPHCILSLPSRFTADALASWLTIETERTTARYGDYVKRRKVGGRREMFEDYDDAVRWCRESAVVKYVDGAWLQGTLRSTTGVTSAMEDAAKAGGAEASDEGCARATEAEWRAARVSWQVLSEELGDGDLDRSHVDAFQRLVDAHATDGKQQPRGYELDFLTWLTDDAQDQPNKQPWVAALLQLTVSASPNEFLPEMLGFNLSYEGLPYHLLVTARELRELGIDPYYFVLHISIDNVRRLISLGCCSAHITRMHSLSQVTRRWLVSPSKPTCMKPRPSTGPESLTRSGGAFKQATSSPTAFAPLLSSSPNLLPLLLLPTLAAYRSAPTTWMSQQSTRS